MEAAGQGRFNYLVIGHVTRDRVPGGGFTTGGTASYAALTARALGCGVRLLTSADRDLSLENILPGVESVRIPAPATTTFENRYARGAREQILLSVAAPLTPGSVPLGWRGSDVVHLGPVAQECDPALANFFPEAFLGVTPQGWMRQWDGGGRVSPAPWDSASVLLARADAVVLSEDDVGSDEEVIRRWAACARVLAVTRGAAGCTVHAGGTVEEVPGLPALEEDPTGAGDVFAAVFFVQLRRGSSVRAAARLANCVASGSVTRVGLEGTPVPEEVDKCLRLCA